MATLLCPICKKLIKFRGGNTGVIDKDGNIICAVCYNEMRKMEGVRKVGLERGLDGT